MIGCAGACGDCICAVEGNDNSAFAPDRPEQDGRGSRRCGDFISAKITPLKAIARPDAHAWIATTD